MLGSLEELELLPREEMIPPPPLLRPPPPAAPAAGAPPAMFDSLLISTAVTCFAQGEVVVNCVTCCGVHLEGSVFSQNRSSAANRLTKLKQSNQKFRLMNVGFGSAKGNRTPI